MGHKYSTIYNHNTNASFQEFQECQKFESMNGKINNIIHKIGNDKCLLIKDYPLHQYCKLCKQSMYEKTVLMLYCSKFKHKYHAKCVTSFIEECFYTVPSNTLNIIKNSFNNNQYKIKCRECRYLFALYFINI